MHPVLMTCGLFLRPGRNPYRGSKIASEPLSSCTLEDVCSCGIAVIQLLKGTPFKESKVLLNLFERIFGSYFLVAVAAVEVPVLVPEEELINVCLDASPVA